MELIQSGKDKENLLTNTQKHAIQAFLKNEPERQRYEETQQDTIRRGQPNESTIDRTICYLL